MTGKKMNTYLVDFADGRQEEHQSAVVPWTWRTFLCLQTDPDDAKAIKYLTFTTGFEVAA